ncbi:hypothetical protein TSUD_260200 [Trifolium subterraneum]|uniref:Uncharacterized protein n=1 Tax=Trifolium subterraneum TaxID=3900 RepID=A0A2Z6M1E1_TRISU|nr:hypothetical protein TSUD_260200 [Trifolium subterraneum]
MTLPAKVICLGLEEKTKKVWHHLLEDLPLKEETKKTIADEGGSITAALLAQTISVPADVGSLIAILPKKQTNNIQTTILSFFCKNMASSSALLGQKKDNPDGNPKKSKDEEDLQERKKMREKVDRIVTWYVGVVRRMMKGSGVMKRRRLRRVMSGGGSNQGANISASGGDGPWRVVQKQRRNRKPGGGKQGVPAEEKRNSSPVIINANPTVTNVSPKISGSRFITLSEEYIEVNEDDMEIGERDNNEEIEDVILVEKKQNTQNQQKNMQRNKRGSNGGSAKKVEGQQEKINKENKLVPRGGSNFKGKTGSNYKKGVESLAEMMGESMMESLKAHYQKPIDGLARPQNRAETSYINSSPFQQGVDDTGGEVEIFEDANDQGSVGTSDS